MAPEIIMENIYNEKADVFSYGMVMAEILSRVAPDMKNFIRQMPEFGIDSVSLPPLSRPLPSLSPLRGLIFVRHLSFFAERDSSKG